MVFRRFAFELVEVLFAQRPRRDAVLHAQGRRRAGRNPVLPGVAHELYGRARDVRGADVFARREQIVDVGRVQAPEGDRVGLEVALDPLPVPEAEIVFGVARVVQAEGARVFDDRIRKSV